ncbi:MAG: lipolytic protein G-D-S-L family [Rhodopirellula sp.]|nr:lipolytic protein G-D-S-L family [Rhodopirellula sp.]
MKPDQLNRRQLLQSSIIAAGAAAALNATTRCAVAAESNVTLKEGDVILFQGDSITDAGRDRNSEAHANNPSGLGKGYPFLLAGGLLQAHAKLGLKVYNRGISGHKVPDLQKRWQKDTLDLKPAVLSILVGVNDIWHKFAGRYDGTVKDYGTGFTALLQQTKEALPETTIVVCEPFALRCGAVKDEWFPEFDERRAVAKEVAKAAGTLWVPFQTMFDEAIADGTTPNYWAGDGVHPTLAGHALMAKTWREVVGV